MERRIAGGLKKCLKARTEFSGRKKGIEKDITGLLPLKENPRPRKGIDFLGASGLGYVRKVVIFPAALKKI